MFYVLVCFTMLLTLNKMNECTVNSIMRHCVSFDMKANKIMMNIEFQAYGQAYISF